jgi:hypothetical protein
MPSLLSRPVLQPQSPPQLSLSSPALQPSTWLRTCPGSALPGLCVVESSGAGLWDAVLLLGPPGQQTATEWQLLGTMSRQGPGRVTLHFAAGLREGAGPWPKGRSKQPSSFLRRPGDYTKETLSLLLVTLHPHPFTLHPPSTVTTSRTSV